MPYCGSWIDILAWSLVAVVVVLSWFAGSERQRWRVQRFTSSTATSTAATAATVTKKMESLVVEPTGAHLGTVFFLHGSGGNATEIIRLINAIRGAWHQSLKFVVPEAPKRPYTLASGDVIPIWFDRDSLDLDCKEDWPTITSNAALLQQMIDSEIAAGIPANRIALIGFSQGGAMAIYAGLHFSPVALSSVVVLSSFLPSASKLLEEGATIRTDVPVLVAHGNSDPSVSWEWGERTADLLRPRVLSLDWHLIAGLAHSFNYQEMMIVFGFVHSRIVAAAAL